MTSPAPIRTIAVRLLLEGILLEGHASLSREARQMAREARLLDQTFSSEGARDLAERCEKRAHDQIADLTRHIKATEGQARRLASLLDGHVPFPAAQQASLQLLLSRMRLRLCGEHKKIPFPKIEVRAEFLNSLADALNEPSGHALSRDDLLGRIDSDSADSSPLQMLLVAAIRMLEPSDGVDRTAARKAVRRADSGAAVEAKVLTVIIQHPEYTTTRIAKAAGCSRSALYRNSRIKAALGARGARKDERRSSVIRRGTRQNVRHEEE